MFIVRFLHIGAIHMVGRLKDRNIGQDIEDKCNETFKEQEYLGPLSQGQSFGPLPFLGVLPIHKKKGQIRQF